MKGYRWMGTKNHLMTSGKMEKVRKIVVLTGSMRKTVLKRTITTLARSEVKAAVQLCSQKKRTILSTSVGTPIRNSEH